MRKYVIALLAVLLAVSMCGCANSAEVSAQNDNSAAAATGTDKDATMQSDADWQNEDLPYHPLSVEEMGRTWLFNHNFVSGNVESYRVAYDNVLYKLIGMGPASEGYEQFMSNIYVYDATGYPYIPEWFYVKYFSRCFDFTLDDIRTAIGDYNAELKAYRCLDGIGGSTPTPRILSDEEADGIHTAIVELYDYESGMIYGTAVVNYRTVNQENQYISCKFEPYK